MTHAHHWIINAQKSELGYCRGCGAWRSFLADFGDRTTWKKSAIYLKARARRRDGCA